MITSRGEAGKVQDETGHIISALMQVNIQEMIRPCQKKNHRGQPEETLTDQIGRNLSIKINKQSHGL